MPCPDGSFPEDAPGGIIMVRLNMDRMYETLGERHWSGRPSQRIALPPWLATRETRLSRFPYWIPTFPVGPGAGASNDSDDSSYIEEVRRPPGVAV